MKKVLFVFISVLLILSLVSCGSSNTSILVEENLQVNLEDSNSIKNIHSLALNLLKFSNNSRGFSIVGTQADKDKAEYLKETFQEIGLSNVHYEEIQMDGWVLQDISLTYECNCENVETKTIYSVVTYPRNFNFNNEYLQMVNVGEGTDIDFDNVGDLKFKGVIFSNSENLVEKVQNAVDKGAELILYVDTSSNRSNINSYKIDLDLEYNNQLSKEVPIFVMSEMIYSAFQRDVPVYQSTTVQIKGISELKSNVNGLFLVGEIEGKSNDNIVYVTANRDTLNQGYLSSCISIGTLVEVAKELVEEQINPNCTIRFLITTGHEWGSINGGYNIGIQKYIDKHKAENIKCVVSLDGLKLLKSNSNIETFVSSDILKEIQGIESSLGITEIKNTVNKIDELDNERAKDLEGVVWFNSGYSVVVPVELGNSLYYIYKETNLDEPSIGIGTEISNYAVLFYKNVIKGISKK